MPMQRQSVVLLAWSICFLAHGRPASAQCPGLDYGAYIHLEGILPTAMNPSDIEVAGSAAYLSGSLGLEIYDISDRSSPILLGSTPLADWGHGLTIVGTHVYVADSDSGLTIVDVQNPALPVIIGRAVLSDDAQDVEVRDDHAYVTDFLGDFHVVDVSDKTKPELIRTVPTPSISIGVDVQGDYAYIADGFSGLQIVDISDPDSASIVGSVSPIGAFEECEVVGNYAYCADHESGFTIVDVSDPTNPMIAANVPPESIVLSVSVVGNTAFVSDLQGGKGVVLFDVSDPTKPAEITAIPIDESFITAVAGFLYTGSQILDVSAEELAPRENRANLGAGVCGRKFHVAGSYAYVAAEQRLQILQLPDAFPLQLLGSSAMPGDAYDVFVSGNSAYVGYADGLQIVNVSNRDGPSNQGFVMLNDVALGVVAAGDYAYIANDSEGLQVVNVGIDPLLPAALGNEPTSNTARDVVLIDGHAVVADGTGGIRVVDVSDPLAPFTVTTLSPPANAVALAVDGALLYVAGDGLDVVDVTNVLSPAYLGGFAAGTLNGVAVDGAGYAYTTSGARVDVFNVIDPNDIHRIGTAYPGETLGGVAVGDAVFASGLGIFDVYRKNCSPTVTTTDPRPLFPGFLLHPVRPNPVRAGADIVFETAAAARVTLQVYDVNGRLVQSLSDDSFSAGRNTVRWEGRDDRGNRAATGVYVIELKADGVRLSRKLTFVR